MVLDHFSTARNILRQSQRIDPVHLLSQHRLLRRDLILCTDSQCYYYNIILILITGITNIGVIAIIILIT